MCIHTRDGDSMRQLRAMRAEQGNVFQAGHGLAVLDGGHARDLNATNFADVTLPDRFVDLIRGRESHRVTWKDVRATWTAPLKALAEAPQVAALDHRLRQLTDERLSREVELPWAIQEIFTRALIPTVIADLSPRDMAKVVRDQTYKLTRLMRTEPREETFRERLESAYVQMRAGFVARRVLRGRSEGKRPRMLDLADPIVDQLDTLGMDRASFAVTSILTAIAGPPGAVAVCMLLELVRRPDWATTLRDELASLDDEHFYASPTRSAPTTYRFVKETLRMWSSPLVLTRVVRTELEVDGHALEPGDQFHLSPYFAHHDSGQWADPEVFDPDRWLPGSERAPAHACAYAPFGWKPTSCIGAALGTTELILLARLFTTDYRIDAIDPENVEVVLAAVPLPIGFRGTIERR